MNLQTLQRIVIDALEDVKGQDIKVFNTTAVTDLFDRVFIASASSNRQARALADRVRERVKQAGAEVLSVEGEETGEWVLVDLGSAVVHIMQPAIRAYYNLEELWGASKVHLRAASTRATKPGHSASTAKKPRAGAPRTRATGKSGQSSKSKATGESVRGAKPARTAKRAPAGAARRKRGSA